MDGTRRPVVVGVDGSPQSRGALHWAAREAAHRGLTLRILHAAGSADPEVWSAARAMVANAVYEARHISPNIPVTSEVVDDSPISTLCAASKNSTLVVVAGRGVGGFPGLLLGSVAGQLALHAHGQVTIVHNDNDNDNSNSNSNSNSNGDRRQGGALPNAQLPVLVGFDSSRDSDHALGAAFEAAAARGVPVVAIRTWQPPSVAHRGTVRRSKLDDATTGRCERYAVSEALDSWRVTYPDVEVVTRVAADSAAGALVAASRDAQLLFVGSRGHADLAGPRLGATTLQVLHHASCPVMVVRAPSATRPAAATPASAPAPATPGSGSGSDSGSGSAAGSEQVGAA